MTQTDDDDQHEIYDEETSGRNGEHGMHAEHQARIGRPVEEVFDFLAQGTNNARWQPGVVRTTQVDDTLGVGTAFRQSVRHPLGFTVSANYRLTVFERPQALAMVVTSGGPIRPTIAYQLQEDGDDTMVRCTIEYRPAGAGRLALPFLALVHPLFAWEASWVDRAAAVIATSPS